MYEISEDFISRHRFDYENHNPLKILNAEELARILNHDNEIRERARASRLKGS